MGVFSGPKTPIAEHVNGGGWPPPVPGERRFAGLRPLSCAWDMPPADPPDRVHLPEVCRLREP